MSDETQTASGHTARPTLESLAPELGLEGQISNLVEAERLSDQEIQWARDELEASRGLALAGDQSVADIVAFGSLARREFTPESDFDYLVVLTGLPDDPAATTTLLTSADAVGRKLAVKHGKKGDAKKPGASGLFGYAVSAHEITDRIGLQDDSNHNQTRRLEFLEESVSLLNADVHRKVLEHTLRRYLHVFVGELEQNHVPRFLLNDVVRYWRTIAVDYQAKVWGNAGTDWGLRYLKLIIPRKLTFAASAAVILACGSTDHGGDAPLRATVEDLSSQFTMPPLVRFALLAPHFGQAGRDALRDCLLAADQFVGWSKEEAWRDEVKKVSDRRNQDPEIPEFGQARVLARELQTSLETIFFTEPLLKDRSIRYLAI